MNDVIFKWRQLSHIKLWIIVRYITVCYRWFYKGGVLELHFKAALTRVLLIYNLDTIHIWVVLRKTSAW